MKRLVSNYLGSLIIQDGPCEKEIISRIARAKNAFTKRKELLTKASSLCLKKRIIKTVIWSTRLYAHVRRLDSYEMWL